MGLTRAWKTLRIVLAAVRACVATHAGRGSSVALTATLSIGGTLCESPGSSGHSQEDRLRNHLKDKVLELEDALRRKVMLSTGQGVPFQRNIAKHIYHQESPSFPSARHKRCST